MASPLAFIFFCTLIPVVWLYYEDTRTLPPPEWPKFATWAEQVGNSHLTSLTGELVRDATLRMRTVALVGIKYEKNLMFKIGAVCASIQTLFARMIAIYKDVSNLTRIREVDWYRDYAIMETVEAISLTQSLLFRIRLEKQLFLEITRQDQDEKMAEYEALVTKFGKMPGKKGAQQAEMPYKPMMGGLYVPRRSNSWYADQFNAKFDFDKVLTKRLMEDPTKPQEVVAKPKKQENDLKKPATLATLGPKIQSRRAGNLSLNPYAELYALLGPSRHEPTLLKLLPASGRHRHARVLKTQRDAEPEPKPSRRSSDGSIPQWDSKIRNVNSPPVKKTPLWQAPTNQQHPYASNPTINKQINNNPYQNDNKKTSETTRTNVDNKSKQLTNSKMDAEVKRVPPQYNTKSNILENKNSQKMADSSTPKTQNNPIIDVQQNPNLRESNNQKTSKRPLWQPGNIKNNAKVSVQRDTSQNRGERSVKYKPNRERDEQIALSYHNVQQTIKNNAELSMKRQDLSAVAKRPIWRPGGNRRAFDNDGPIVNYNDRLSVQPYSENRGERSVKRHWNPEYNQHNYDLANMQTVKNNTELSVQGNRRERKQPIWQPGQYRRSFDDINEPSLNNNAGLSVQRNSQKRGERAVKPKWRRQINQPSPWLYHNSNKTIDKQISERNNHELSTKVKSPIWQPGPNFRRTFDDEDDFRQLSRNNPKLSVHQNYRMSENRGERSVKKLPEHLLKQRSFMYEQFVKQKALNNAKVSV